jgi:hypothetical protein
VPAELGCPQAPDHRSVNLANGHGTQIDGWKMVRG